MSVRTRLKKLEQRAGVGQMCLACKRNLILYSDIIRRTSREDIYARPCETCGFPSFALVSGYSERELALMFELMGVASTGGQARPRTLAERQRNYAAQLYCYILPRSREIREMGEREEKRLRSVEPPPASVRAQLKVLDEWKALEADREAARKLRVSEEEAEERETRRAKSAPTMAVIDRVRGEHAPNGRLSHRSDEGLYYLHLMAGLEPLIYGETLPETLAKIDARERHIREEAERQERERQEREERWRCEREEREEKYRLEREQREREREERERARCQSAVPVKESGAWLRDYQLPTQEGAEDVTRLAGKIVREAYDPAHPDAVQLQRSMLPDPTRGLTIDDLEAERTRANDSRRYYHGEYYDGDRHY